MENTSFTSTVNPNASKKLLKPFLGRRSDWHLNACVGGNTGSHDNSIGYAEGFKTAAEVMLRLLGVAPPPKAGENWGEYPLVDTLVYPICYSARHHIELALKRSLPKAWKIFKLRSPTNSHYLTELSESALTHSVTKIWRDLDIICEKVQDNRLIALVKSLEPYVIGIDEIDSSGQTFRYASNAESSNTHLSNLSHINLQHFAEWYAELCELLEDLELLLDSLAFEYSTGSFTSKLTRDQLIEIAKQLPPRDQWESSAFTEAKEKIRTDFHLSSRDFQRACNTIQNTMALAHYIGKPIPIEGLKEDTFLRLHKASKMCNSALESFDLRERSVIFGLLSIGSPCMYPESFESFLRPRPINEDDAFQFDLERDPAYLARKVSSTPDIVERALSGLGQLDMLAKFRSVFSEEIRELSELRESSKNVDFAELIQQKLSQNRA